MRLVGVLVLCIFTASAGANPAFDTWADAFAADWVRLAPETATQSQYFRRRRAGHARPPAHTADASTTAAGHRACARRAEQLDLWLAGPLDPAQRISAAIIRRELDDTLAGERFQDHGFVFNQLRGAHVQPVLFLTEIHPLRNAADVASYLARPDLVARRQDEGIALARAAAARDLIPPRFIVERARRAALPHSSNRRPKTTCW